MSISSCAPREDLRPEENPNMTPRLTVVGSLNMDLVVRAPRIPHPGETIIGTDFRTVPGGKGANQALAAARLGAQVAMVGRVGQDDYGVALLKNLRDAQVDHSHVIRDREAPTGVALIVVDDAGENSIVVASGANSQLTSADVDSAFPAIAAADALILQLESPIDAVTHAAQVAHEHRVKVILNPAPARKALHDLLPLVDVLIPNEHEAMLLTGTASGDVSGIEDAAARLIDKGVETVVVTLGHRGALLAREGETGRVPAFTVTAVDTTAAGDAFVAGFSLAMAAGRPLVEAVLWGNAAGALAATRLGAQSSLPTRRELVALLDSAPRESV
jgi:ribokinase